jgi:hypothetical protein
MLFFPVALGGGAVAALDFFVIDEMSESDD